MPARNAFEWALVRVVPRVERGEFVNAGVILHCRARDVLAARIHVDRARLIALFPSLDLDAVERHLAAIPAICEGHEAGGPIGRLPLTDRFHWLVAPRSTVVQTSPVHTGLCDSPDDALTDLMRRYVDVHL